MWSRKRSTTRCSTFTRLVAQKNVEQETLDNPMLDLYSVGVVARVANVTPFPNGCVKVVLEGDSIVDLRSIALRDGFLQVTVSPREHFIKAEDKSEKFEDVLNMFREYAMHRNIADGMVEALFTMDSHINAFYGMIPFLSISLSEKQALLELETIDALADRLISLMQVAQENENVMIRVQQNAKMAVLRNRTSCSRKSRPRSLARRLKKSSKKKSVACA